MSMSHITFYYVCEYDALTSANKTYPYIELCKKPGYNSLKYKSQS